MERKKYHTYIIYSYSTDRYYTGYTGAGLQKRIERHNKGDNPSTKPGIPWRLKYFRSFALKKEAIKWENYIKRQKSRHFIEKLYAQIKMSLSSSVESRQVGVFRSPSIYPSLKNNTDSAIITTSRPILASIK